MTIIKLEREKPVIPMTEEIAKACEDYRHYVEDILLPADRDLYNAVENQKILLYQAYGINLVTAHSVDYLLAIRAAASSDKVRSAFVKKFDDLYAVPGAYIQNRKMELIDAINNGFKHIRIDVRRYQEVIKHYGAISFQSLVQDNGRILCVTDKYRFDYCRVVLIPALSALVSVDLESNEDVFAFAMGGSPIMEHELSFESYSGHFYDEDDPTTAIDRMIEMSNPPCANCREGIDSCVCSEFKFDGKSGEYKPMFTPTTAEINNAMSQISPSWSRS